MLPAVANRKKHTFGGFLSLGLTSHFHVGVPWTTCQVNHLYLNFRLWVGSWGNCPKTISTRKGIRNRTYDWVLKPHHPLAGSTFQGAGESYLLRLVPAVGQGGCRCSGLQLQRRGDIR